MSPLETLVVGRGDPVAVVAHGLGGSIDETRPLASGIGGTRVFYAARGHGGSPLGAEPVSYAVLARDLDAVAAAHGATRAMGVSMGAGTVLALLAEQGDRFERALLLLPPPPGMELSARHEALLAALDAEDLGALRQGVRDDLPEGVRAEAYVAARAEHLLASTGVAAVLRALQPLRLDLSGVTAQVLVLAQTGDAAHPVDAAEHWASELPGAELVVLGPGAVFRERARLRALVRNHFG